MKHVPMKRFCGDQSGSILLLVGLSFLFLVAAAGAGYDLGRYELVKQKIQQAADASALAGASLALTATDADRIAEANRYFMLNYPTTYLSVARPTPTITSTGGVVSVSANATLNTNFVVNIGIATLTSAGASQVQVATSATSDYDVVMVVDESGSECADVNTGAFGAQCYIGHTTSPPGSREAAQQSAITTMANAIVPVGGTNANVRMGFIGFSGRITNKWGLSNRNSDALTAISNLRPVYQNFDHTALLAAQQMLLGGSGAVANARIGGGFGETTVAANTAAPLPRTARTNTSDGNGIAPVKYVVFVSDGGIMVEPDDTHAPVNYPYGYGEDDYDPTGLVHSSCPGRNIYPVGAYYTGSYWNYHECFPAFNAACTQLRNTGGADNVHVFFINLKNPVTPPELTSLTTCASTTLSGGPVYTAAEKPDPSKDFFIADNSAELASILQNITSVIQKQRIIQ